MANDTPDADRLLSERAVLAALDALSNAHCGSLAAEDAIRALPSQPAASAEVATLERVRERLVGNVEDLRIIKQMIQEARDREGVELLDAEARRVAPVAAPREPLIVCTKPAYYESAKALFGGEAEAPSAPAMAATCKHCEGSGRAGDSILDNEHDCIVCDGTGRRKAPAPAAGADVGGLLAAYDKIDQGMLAGSHGYGMQSQVTAQLCQLAHKMADALRSTEAARVRAEARLEATQLREHRTVNALAAERAAHAETRQRCQVLDAALVKVNGIRNSIVGMHGFNFSEHAYPLVAALDAAGYEGLPYPEARANLGTLIEQAKKAEEERDAARRELEEVRAQLGDAHSRLTVLTDKHFGCASTMPVDALIARLEAGLPTVVAKLRQLTELESDDLFELAEGAEDEVNCEWEQKELAERECDRQRADEQRQVLALFDVGWQRSGPMDTDDFLHVVGLAAKKRAGVAGEVVAGSPTVPESSLDVARMWAEKVYREQDSFVGAALKSIVIAVEDVRRAGGGR